jgi:RNA polymerase sigma-70 factor (ECF subfamily)
MNGDSATEDVVAEAYLLAARSFKQFDPSRAQFSTWVTRIATNCMVSHYRKERPVVPLDGLMESAISCTDETDTVGDQELVARLLAVLDDRGRQVVLMKYRDGMRNVEIASQLEMNSSTVSTILARSISKMREAYERGM